VIVTHKDGTIMLVNKQAEAMFGYNREELVGEFVEKLLPKDLQEIHVQHRDDYASAPRLRKMGTGLDFAGKRKDGSEFPLDIKLSPLFIEEELQTMAIIRDITERKQAEEHVFQAARLAALGQMATALAHELNNPLQIIQGYLDIILDFPINVDEEQSYLQIIRQQIDRLHDVSQGILNYAQPKQKAHQLVDLADTISQVLTLADKQLQHSDTRVVTDIENVPPVLALPDSLVQVFLNLTINAIESFDDNKGLLHIALKSNNGQVNASFRTNGPSIAAKDLPHIFEPFYTTKPGGNGLGLWICRDLVEQYQGTLLAENLADGQGVVFTATFPASSRIVEDDE
jgi:PAS domain S-box-containing protein